MSGTRFIGPRAPATEAPLHGGSLLICAHGGGDGDAGVRARAASLAERVGPGKIAGCCLFGKPRLEEVLFSLVTRPILLVPLFMSDGATMAALRRRLDDLCIQRDLVLCPPLGGHPDLPGHIAEWAHQDLRARGWATDETGLLLVGHGSRRNCGSRRAIDRLTGAIARRGLFGEVRGAFLEEAPRVDWAIRQFSCDRVVVAGCFVERGRHATVDVPRLCRGSGRKTVYLGPLGAASWVDDLILDQAGHGERLRPRIWAA